MRHFTVFLASLHALLRQTTSLSLLVALALAAVTAPGLSAQVADPSFTPSPDNYPTALVVQPDGKLLVGGTFFGIAGTTRSYLVRFNADGTLDPAFSVTLNAPVFALALQPDGRILVGGSFGGFATIPPTRLLRLLPDGKVDTTFAPAVIGNAVRALAIQPDGQILVGGDFTSVGGRTRSHFARLAADGSLDPNFAADVTGPASPTAPGVFALALQPDGAVIIGGQFVAIAGHPRLGLARVSSVGKLDIGYNPAGTTANITTLHALADGYLLVGGSFSSLGGATRRNLARLRPDGTTDPLFNPQPSTVVRSFAVQGDGRIVIGGLFTAIGSIARSYLARLEPDGPLDPTFPLEASGILGNFAQGVTALALGPDGRLYIGGGFTTLGGRPLVGLARTLPPPPQFATSPSPVVSAPGRPVTLIATLVHGTATFQWTKDGTPISGATASTFTLPAATTADSGRYALVASNAYGTSTSRIVTVSIGFAPTIFAQPVAVVAAEAERVAFAVIATASPDPTYQWQRNGLALPGATSPQLVLPSVGFPDSGDYSCLVSNPFGIVASLSASLRVEPAVRLTNLSVRTALAAGELLIVGYVARPGSMDVLVRAAGPALADFGVRDAMTDPRLELYRDSTKLLENDSWPSGLASTATTVGAFPFAINSRDAALAHTATGASSVLVSGSGSGIVLVEAYDTGATGAAHLINLSTRNRVGTGDEVLIVGLTLSGRGSRRLLLRAVGPTLGGVPFQVPGVLADPLLALYDATGAKLAENDNWAPALAPTFSVTGAFALAPNSRDAALLVTLPAGSYTAQVSGVANTTGTALVEVYEVP